MDMWAAHSVTHALHMQARWDEGLSWLDACLPKWVNTNNFTNHLHWHKALMLVDSGNAEAALELYDECLVAPLRTTSIWMCVTPQACFTDWKCAGLI